ncbi:MAG: hypothetical protein DRO04_02760 [Candidatus Iainarchaeum archaeon]|uniref:Uncharacterized protein n=1 Tax=Candidatus Iainarchaeum sp. TaxID=3101447 RepID=A0A497JHG6_9ARCH|nr:MAG: hypothetical protein DRO04_02760 [Candidatus Diapherotrites archaeon]
MPARKRKDLTSLCFDILLLAIAAIIACGIVFSSLEFLASIICGVFSGDAESCSYDFGESFVGSIPIAFAILLGSHILHKRLSKRGFILTAIAFLCVPVFVHGIIIGYSAGEFLELIFSSLLGVMLSSELIFDMYKNVFKTST